jgi:multisubunit Na+/H+ antiporter MnhB subunit
MTQRASVLFKTGWISLAIIGVAILVFGLIVTAMPASSDPPYLRAIGVVSIGMGLFGLLITTIAYRRRERWAWFALWYYPVFWTAHLVGGLPPGNEHIHQIVFIVLSLAGLLLSVGEFFPRRGAWGNSRKRR